MGSYSFHYKSFCGGKKAVASVLAWAYFFTQVLFSPAFVESSHAQEAAQKRQLAMAVNSQTPDFWRSRNLGITNASRLINEQEGVSSEAVSKAAPQALQAILQKTPPVLRLNKIHKGQAAQPSILLIQDVHMNAEAQRNIGEAILAIDHGATGNRKEAGVLIGVEAAHGPFDFSAYREFPDQKIMKEIADYLLQNNRITAASWLGLVAEETPAIVGVDDAKLYRANVNAYRESFLLQARAERALERELAALRNKVGLNFSKEKAAFFKEVMAYYEGSRTLEKYVATLSHHASLVGYPALANFVSAIEMEKSLDSTSAERERSQLLEKLSSNGGKTLEPILNLSLAYRSGQLNGGEFHQRLGALIREAGVDLSRYPSFEKYLLYVNAADNLSHDALFQELRRMTREAIAQRVPSAGQRKVFERGIYLQLARRLVKFELTPEEWQEYQKAMPRNENGFSPGTRHQALNLSSFEKFYEVAEGRNRKMVENFIARLNTQADSACAVLVAGGFHTPGLVSLLEKKGHTVAVLSPKFSLSGGGGGSDYLHEFIRERTPLAKLFAGEKLAMLPDKLQAGAPLNSGFEPAKAGPEIGVMATAAAAVDGIITVAEETAIRRMMSFVKRIVLKGRDVALETLRGTLRVVRGDLDNAPSSAVYRFQLPSGLNGYAIAVTRHEAETLTVDLVFYLYAVLVRLFRGQEAYEALLTQEGHDRYAVKVAPWVEAILIFAYSAGAYNFFAAASWASLAAPGVLAALSFAVGIGLFFSSHYITLLFKGLSSLIRGEPFLAGYNPSWLSSTSPRGPPSWAEFLVKDVLWRFAGSLLFLSVGLILLHLNSAFDPLLPVPLLVFSSSLGTIRPHKIFNVKSLQANRAPLSPHLYFSTEEWPGLSGDFERALSAGRPVHYKGKKEDLTLKATVWRLFNNGLAGLDGILERFRISIPRRMYLGGLSSVFYKALVFDDVKRRFKNVDVQGVDFQATGHPSDFNGLVESADKLLEDPEIWKWFSSGGLITEITDVGYKSRLRLGALGAWQGTVPLPMGTFAAEQVKNLMALLVQLPNMGRDCWIIRGSDNVNMDDELMVGKIPLNKINDHPETKDWKILNFGMPLIILTKEQWKKMDQALTELEKTGVLPVNAARLSGIFNDDEMAKISKNVQVVRSLGVMSGNAETGKLLHFVEKFPEMGLEEKDIIMAAYHAGGVLLKNMFQTVLKREALLARQNMANFQISWKGQRKRLRDVYAPRYFQAFGSIVTSPSAELFIENLPKDLTKTIDGTETKPANKSQPDLHRHLKLIWHLCQAFHQGGAVSYFEDYKNPLNWGVVRKSHDGKSVYAALPHENLIFELDDDKRPVRLTNTVFTGETTEVTIYEFSEHFEWISNRYKEIEWNVLRPAETTTLPLDPNPIYTVSIGDNAYWKDAGTYSELMKLYEWILFDNEGRAYANLPPVEVNVVDTYIDPDMLKDKRIEFKGEHYALINCSVRGKGRVVIEEGVGLAWVDIDVPEGQTLHIGPGYRWIVGSTRRGGNLRSGVEEKKRGGLFINYHHPDDQDLISFGGEVRKTVIGWDDNLNRDRQIILRDTLFVESSGKLEWNDVAFGKDELIGDEGKRYTFEGWRDKVNLQAMRREHESVVFRIIERNKDVVHTARSEGHAFKIGRDTYLVRPKPDGESSKWEIVHTDLDRVTRFEDGQPEEIGPEVRRYVIGGSPVAFYTGTGTLGWLTGRPVLFVEVGNHQFAISESHPQYRGELVVGYDGDHVVAGGDWMTVGPVLDDEGRQLSFRGRVINGAEMIGRPVSNHVSAIEDYTFAPYGRSYATPEEAEGVREERNYLFIDAQNSSLLVQNGDESLLRKLSGLADMLASRQDIPRVLAWPPYQSQETAGLTITQQIAFLEEGLSELMGRPTSLSEIIDHVIVPDWRDRDPSLDVGVAPNGQPTRDLLYVSEMERAALMEKGLYMVGIKLSPNNHGSYFYPKRRVNDFLSKRAEDYKRLLGWSENPSEQALLGFDLEESVVPHHVSERRGTLADVTTSGVAPLLRRMISTLGLRLAVTTTAPLERVKESLTPVPSLPAGKKLTLNADGANRIFNLRSERGKTIETADSSYEDGRLMDPSEGGKVSAVAEAVLKQQLIWNSDGTFRQVLTRNYIGRGKMSGFDFGNKPAVIIEKASRSSLAARVFVINVPSEEEFVPLTPTGEWPTDAVTGEPVPKVRSQMVGELQAKLDAEFKKFGKKFIAVPVGDRFISILKVPESAEEETANSSVGKVAFFDHVVRVDGIPLSNILYVADQIHPGSPEMIPGIWIAATNRDQDSVPPGVFRVGPNREGTKHILTLLDEIIRSEKLQDNPRPAVLVLLEKLKEESLPSTAVREDQEVRATSTLDHMFSTSLFLLMMGIAGFGMYEIQSELVFVAGIAGVWALAAATVALAVGDFGVPVAITDGRTSLFGTVSEPYRRLPLTILTPHRLEEFSHAVLYRLQSGLAYVGIRSPLFWNNEILSHTLTAIWLLGISWVGAILIITVGWVAAAAGVLMVAALGINSQFAHPAENKKSVGKRSSIPSVMSLGLSELTNGTHSLFTQVVVGDIPDEALRSKKEAIAPWLTRVLQGAAFALSTAAESRKHQPEDIERAITDLARQKQALEGNQRWKTRTTITNSVRSFLMAVWRRLLKMFGFEVNGIEAAFHSWADIQSLNGDLLNDRLTLLAKQLGQPDKYAVYLAIDDENQMQEARKGLAALMRENSVLTPDLSQIQDYITGKANPYELAQILANSSARAVSPDRVVAYAVDPNNWVLDAMGVADYMKLMPDRMPEVIIQILNLENGEMIPIEHSVANAAHTLLFL